MYVDRRTNRHEVYFARRAVQSRCALSANEMDVLDVPISRDHSINATAS